MKTYRIFLASSSELLDDRREFSDLINYLNNENVRLNRGAQFQQVKWEWVDESVGDLRKQDDYNRLLTDCDLFVMLYWTKVGKYSEEEFDQAYARLRGTRRLFVYKKTAIAPNLPSEADKQSRIAFETKLLASPEHFVGEYATAEGLKHKVQTELARLFDDGVLTYDEMLIANCLSAGQPAVPTGFVGRNDELRTIRRKMDEGGTLMLINAEGGMGKTSIAAKYWAEHLYRYRFNAWLFCENGIVEELKKLAPQLNLDLSQIPENQHVDVLRMALQNLPKDCLLVLDNANNPEHIEAFRQTFAGLHWHVLMTSRCHGVLPKGQELPITHLPPPLAKDLFVSYYREETPDFDALLDRLLLAVGYNTLVIELFAKNMAELAAYGETLADFLQRLEAEGLFLRERSFEVKTAYTQHVHRDENQTTDAILNALYDLSRLTDDERFWLVNIALLPAETHLLTFLLQLFAPTDKFAFGRQLKTLGQKGWLNADTTSYRMSPVVQQLVLAKNQGTLIGDSAGLIAQLNYLLANDGAFATNLTITETIPIAQVGYGIADRLPDDTPDKQLLYFNLSVCFQDVGLFSLAMQSAERCAVVNDSKGDLENLAISYSKLGELYQAQGQLIEALDYFQKVTVLFEELYQANPRSESLKNGLAISYSKLGELYQAQGQLAEALDYFQKVTVLFEELYQANPQSVELQFGLATAFIWIGYVHEAMQAEVQALAAYKRAVPLLGQLVVTTPIAQYKEQLDWVRAAVKRLETN